MKWRSSTICTIIIFLYIIISCVRCTENATSENSTVVTASYNESYETTVPSESPPVTTKFQKIERTAKKILGSVVKAILRYMIENEAYMDTQVSPNCTKHLMKMLSGLQKLEIWAFQMFDAFGKLPNGILSGTTSALGDYDSCLSVNAKNLFQGQYCMVDIYPVYDDLMPFTDRYFEYMGRDKLMESLIRSIPTSRLIKQFDLAPFRTAICVPSTCSVRDMQELVTQVMDSTGLEWRAGISTCEIKEPVVFDTSQIAVMCCLGVMMLLAFLGTLLDLYLKFTREDESYKEDSGLFVRLFLCFSVYSNTKKLLQVDESTNSLKLFHGLKLIAMLWSILVHTYSVFMATRATNSIMNARNFFKDITFQVILHGTYGIEAFFFMSAVLLIQNGFRKEKPSFFINLLRRLWRLTPSFMFVIAFSFVFPLMASGPLWKESMRLFIDTCRDTWWTNLLYFNNFISAEKMCLMWTWYIPADTHLYVVGIIVLILVKKFSRVRGLIFAIVIVLSIAIVAINATIYDIPATGILAVLRHIDEIYNFVNHGYIGSHVHAIPTSVGLAVGYILYAKPKMNIPLLVNIVGWLISITLIAAIILSGHEWTQGNNIPSFGIGLLYTCGSKLVWPVALGWITISLSRGTGNMSSAVSNFSALVAPFSRLTYMAYIVHPLVILWYTASSKVLLQTDHKIIVFLFLGVAIITYAVAYVFSQLFEAPFIELDKLLFSETKRTTLSINDTSKVEMKNGNCVKNDFPRYKEKEASAEENIKTDLEA